jgi:hypothetical protein
MTAKKPAKTALADADVTAESPIHSSKKVKSADKAAVTLKASKTVTSKPATKKAKEATTTAKVPTAAKAAKEEAGGSDAVEPKKRGRKAKVEVEAASASKKEAAKKPAFAEDDVGDIEAEIEAELEVAEAEVTVEEAGEDKPKAKPLRMKVSRAKERALMREFGIDDTALSEEEVAKRRHELKTLIKMGKTRGFLTHQEINDHLPEKLVENEILEAIVSMLNDMGVAVPPPPKKKPKKQPKPRCPQWTANSAARPTRCACTCAKWAPSSC